MIELPKPVPKWDGKYPIIGCCIIKDFPRPDKGLVDEYKTFSVPDLSDLIGVLYTMDSGMRPAYVPMKRIVGTAFTVKCPPGDNMFLKYAIQYAKPGDVIVVDARGFMQWAVGGGANAQMARDNGVAGFVVDGAFRDIGQVRDGEIPLICRGVAAATGPKRGPGELNVPVCCGGVVVYPGDIVVADEEGVAVIPRRHAAKVAEAASKKIQYATKETWNKITMMERYAEREEYFNQILEARGCEFIDFIKYDHE